MPFLPQARPRGRLVKFLTASAPAGFRGGRRIRPEGRAGAGRRIRTESGRGAAAGHKGHFARCARTREESTTTPGRLNATFVQQIRARLPSGGGQRSPRRGCAATRRQQDRRTRGQQVVHRSPKERGAEPRSGECPTVAAPARGGVPTPPRARSPRGASKPRFQARNLRSAHLREAEALLAEVFERSAETGNPASRAASGRKRRNDECRPRRVARRHSRGTGTTGRRTRRRRREGRPGRGRSRRARGRRRRGRGRRRRRGRGGCRRGRACCRG